MRAEKPRAEGDLMTVKQAAVALGVAPSTIHRLVNDGVTAGEQLSDELCGGQRGRC